MFKSICNAVVKVYNVIYKLITGIEIHKFEDVIDLPNTADELDTDRLFGGGYIDTKVGIKTNILSHVITIYIAACSIGWVWVFALVNIPLFTLFISAMYVGIVFWIRAVFKVLREISISIARTKIRTNHSIKEISNFNKVGEQFELNLSTKS